MVILSFSQALLQDGGIVYLHGMTRTLFDEGMGVGRFFFLFFLGGRRCRCRRRESGVTSTAAADAADAADASSPSSAHS